jgi:hypothetical protein
MQASAGSDQKALAANTMNGLRFRKTNMLTDAAIPTMRKPANQMGQKRFLVNARWSEYIKIETSIGIM